MHKGITQKLFLASITALLVLSAQDTKPSCNHCSATYIDNDAIQAYLKRAPTGPQAVRAPQVRAVDMRKSHGALAFF